MFQMTETSFMLSSSPIATRVKAAICTIFLMLWGCSIAAQNTTASSKSPYICPAAFEINAQKFLLLRVSIFNGPPEQLMSLVPEDSGRVSYWDIDSDTDPYMVCRYENMDHYIVLHAQGAKRCEAKSKPLRASCQ
jgi:hypothetical protein